MTDSSNESWSTVERDDISVRLDPERIKSKVQWTGAVGRRGELDDLAEEYGFPSRSAFLRCMIRMGMNSLVENDPVEANQRSKTQDDTAVTIRDLIPEGEENAVDMTDEFWDEILRDQMLDIVEQDPNIERSGYKIHR